MSTVWILSDVFMPPIDLSEELQQTVKGSLGAEQMVLLEVLGMSFYINL